MRRVLKLFAPYLAVTLFWCIWPNAWYAILAYHAQIMAWNWPFMRGMRWTKGRKGMLLALPAVCAGPALYVLLPWITRTDLSVWLHMYRLSGPSLWLMIPYFGLVHPVWEQVHWHRLREAGAWSHPLFAGYHMIVLSTLLTLPWLVLCFCLLTGASFAWKRMADKNGNLTVPVFSHILADLGVVVAAWARTPNL